MNVEKIDQTFVLTVVECGLYHLGVVNLQKNVYLCKIYVLVSVVFVNILRGVTVKQKIVLFGLAIVLIFFSHCDRREYDYLRIGIHTFPETLNPLYSTSETSQAIINKVFDSLYYRDYRGELRKGLVKSERITSIDTPPREQAHAEIEILIQLKENVYFSDGKKLDTEDVIQTVRMMQDKNYGCFCNSDIDVIRDIRKIDGCRFIIRLARRLAVWKNILSFKVLNSRELSKATPKSFRHMRLTGTGYYKIKAVKRPVKIVLERNCGRTISPDWTALWENIEYVVVPDTYLVPLKILGGELDICELQPEDAAAYTKNEKWQEHFSLLTYRKFGYTYLVFNMNKPVLTRNIRKIFYHVLASGDFMKSFLGRKGRPVRTPILLLNAGITPTIHPVTPLAQPVRITLLLNSESNIRKELAHFLRKRLKAFNIDLVFDFRDYASLLELLKNGKFSVAISGFILDIDFDVRDLFQNGSRANYARFNNPAMETLLDKGLMEMLPGAREQIYRDVHEMWLKELPIIPLFSLDYNIAVSQRVKIPTNTYRMVGARGDFLFNIQEWGMNRKGAGKEERD
jgi:ABC-type transport system substrate-binding protein